MDFVGEISQLASFQVEVFAAWIMISKGSDLKQEETKEKT